MGRGRCQLIRFGTVCIGWSRNGILGPGTGTQHQNNTGDKARFYLFHLWRISFFHLTVKFFRDKAFIFQAFFDALEFRPLYGFLIVEHVDSPFFILAEQGVYIQSVGKIFSKALKKNKCSDKIEQRKRSYKA